MQILIVWLGVALFAPALALAEPPPPLCQSEACTPRMREIAARFGAAEGFAASDFPLLASGECFHLSPDYDPSVTHYGMTLLDPRGGAVYMGGVFAYFYPADPYQSYTLDQARLADPRLFDANRRLELNPDYAYADMNPGGDSMVRYWLRRTQNKLYLIGQWGIRQRIFCEMDRHE